MKKIRSVSLFRLVASPKLTVICLVLLVIVIIWGTVYQVEHGLYQAQQKFFHSWAVLLFGFIPFPAVVLLFWILFINVSASLLYRIPLRFSNIGNVVTHLGILVFFVGGFFTFYYSQESSLGLREGESSGFSVSDSNWEFVVWQEEGQNRRIYAVDSDRFRSGDSVDFQRLELRIQIKSYYMNCQAYPAPADSGKMAANNSSGILLLRPQPPAKEPPENIPGMELTALFPGGGAVPVLLYGDDRHPTAIKWRDNNLFFQLRKKRFALPFTLKLVDFRRKFYPGSQIVKSYESEVELTVGDLQRKTVISMNNPLRYKDFTLYQSSYYIGGDGNEHTFLAVVKNAARLMPYLSSIIIFLGLCIHFIMMFFVKRKTSRQKRVEP